MSIEKPYLNNLSQGSDSKLQSSCKEKSESLPLLTTTDWNEEWMRLQKTRGASDDSSFWDKRAQHYNRPFGHSNYANEFIEYSEIESGDSIFDMGCGTGVISIPLAKEGHEVLAADFSQGMLDCLKEDAAKAGVNGIRTMKLAWDDDWESHGILPKSYDVAIASRSIATFDLKESLQKLISVAKRRCAITLSAGASPRSDQRILSEVGLGRYIGRDFIYAFMILVEMGYLPEVRYIESLKVETYSSKEEAYASLKKMILDAAYLAPKGDIDSALAKLDSWLDDNLVENPNAGKSNDHGEIEGKLMLKEPRKIIWAHISWNV